MSAGSTKSHILLLGVNHKTAAVEVRERLALTDIDPPALRAFSGLPPCQEVFFLPTCNRVEVLAATQAPAEAVAEIKGLWLTRGEVEPKDLERSLYVYEGADAIRHLFRVASSLDSMVIGEPQILGQLKEAYRTTSEADTLGVLLNRLLHKAFSVAKRIRTETRIASHAVSISYAAVELARKIFGDLGGKRVMLIGAGEMAELAAQHLLANGIDSLVVANRTLSRGVDLARSLGGGSAIALEEVGEALLEVDIVISSTGATGTVIQKEQVRRVMRPRRQKPLFFIDIAVPRDIDPKVNEVGNVYLYDIDDLKGVVEVNKSEREKEALKAERIVEEEVIKFLAWMESLEVVPLIQRIQAKAEAVRQREIARSRQALGPLTRDQEKALEVLTSSIVHKILRDPVVCLRKGSSGGDCKALLDVTSRLFNLNGLEEAAPSLAPKSGPGLDPDSGAKSAHREEKA